MANPHEYVTVWQHHGGMWLVERSHVRFYAEDVLRRWNRPHDRRYAMFPPGVNPNDAGSPAPEWGA